LLNPTPDHDTLLSPLAVAEQLGVSDQTVYNWIREKRIGALKMGRLLRIRQSELERFVAANSTTAGDDQAEFWEDPDAQAFQAPGRTTWR
jgi:excisionase family DNA binding protein